MVPAEREQTHLASRLYHKPIAPSCAEVSALLWLGCLKTDCSAALDLQKQLSCSTLRHCTQQQHAEGSYGHPRSSFSGHDWTSPISRLLWGPWSSHRWAQIFVEFRQYWELCKSHLADVTSHKSAWPEINCTFSGISRRENKAKHQ